jgi:hypothetical protein
MGLRTKHVVEPHLLVLESLLSSSGSLRRACYRSRSPSSCEGSSLVEASGEVGSPSAELSSELVEWTTSACYWKAKHSRLGSCSVGIFLQRGVLSTSSQLA